MVARSSRWGTFLSCTAYKPDGTGCNTIANLGENGQPIVPASRRRTRARRAGRTCSGGWARRGRTSRASDKECKSILEADKTGEPDQPPIETGINCEKCGSKMVVKKSWRGPFLSCSGYPKCRNAKSLQRRS